MKIVYMGTPDFAVSVAEAVRSAGHEIVLAVTQPDKPKGRSGQLQFPDVKVWAMEHEIPVFQPVKIREPENIAELRKYEADLFLVAAFGQILPKEILDMPRYGCVNVHASLLPKYRGAAPIQWSIINGDAVTGVTTMQMGIGLDDGDILLKREVEIAADETGGSLFDRLAVCGGELAVETIAAIEAGQVTPIPQDETQATHVGMIKKEMGHIDFCKSATSIECLIRGLNPWPSAYTYLGDKQLKLWKAQVVESEQRHDRVGHVTAVGKDSFDVSCGTGTLRILEVQLEGKKRMSCGDFLRGNALEVGIDIK